jgi:OFA family oxalate/formate antiporter-like MFS transporter
MSEPAHPGEPPPAMLATSLVVLGAGALLFNCFGTAYAVPVFFPALSQTLAVPLPHLTTLFSATGTLYFALGAASGPLADWIGARIIAAVGCAVLAGGLLVMSRAGSGCAFDIGYLLGAGAGVGLSFMPTVGAVQAPCWKNPEIAGGVAASGIGLGTLVLPSLAQLMIDYVGWRQALLLLSLLAACGGLAALALIRPRTRNDHPRVPLASESPPRFAELLQSGRFQLLYAAQLIVSLVAFVPFVHLVLVARAIGWSVAAGGYLIGMIGIGSLCGRLLLSFAARSLGSCRAASLCAVLMAIAMALLIMVTNGWELSGDAALYGLGYGGVISLTGPIVAEVLGVRGICASVGFVTTSRALGILVGPWAVSVTAHRLGSYDVPFLACASLALIAALLLGNLHRRVPSRPAHQAATAAAFLRGGAGAGGYHEAEAAPGLVVVDGRHRSLRGRQSGPAVPAIPVRWPPRWRMRKG